MQCRSTTNIERARASDAPAIDLPAMLAPLSSYDHFFGPRHIQTLSLATRIAEVLQGRGDWRTAQSILESVVRDVAQTAGRTHDLRLAALTALRNLWLEQSEIAKAIAIQQEIWCCRDLSGGPEAAETIVARTDLETLLMLTSEPEFEI
jgi:hypothetical protein